MRRLGIALLACAGACNSPSRGRLDSRVPEDGDASDASAVDARVDAAPPAPRQLALAVSGQRSSVRVFVATTTSFRKVFDLADGLGYGNGIAWTDYDADERDDLVSSFSVPNMPGQYEMLIVHNDGDTGLTAVNGRVMNPSPLLGYDADSDGDGDVYVATPGGADELFLSNGTDLPPYYSWVEAGNSARENGLDAGDMTGDDRPEVALARGLSGEAISLGTAGPPQPSWSRVATSGFESTDVAMTDWDQDGVLEAVYSKSNTGGTAGSIDVIKWNGTTFTSIYSTTELGGVRVLDWANVDSSGDDDVAVCAGSLLRVYTRSGSTFTPHAINAANVSCLDLAWGDYDADGDPDLAVLGEGLSNAVTVYRNDGGTLTSVFHDDTASATVLAWGRCAPGVAACFSSAPTL